MSTPKKMHFVPQTYLRKFVDEKCSDDRIYMIKKNKTEFNLPIGQPVSLKNICAENYLYSIARPGQKNDPSVELLFHEIFDKNYNTLYDLLVKRHLKDISETLLYEIMAWFASMYLRNGQMIKYLLHNFYKKFEGEYEKAKNTGKQSFIHRKHEIPIDGKSLDELKAEILPWDKPFLNGILLPYISETAWDWMDSHIVSIITLKTDAEFITSDAPMTTHFSRDKNGVKNGGHSRCIPLDCKNLIIIKPNHENQNPLILHRIHVLPENETIYALERNQIQLKLCSRFVLGSHSGLGRFQEEMKPVLKKIYG